MRRLLISLSLAISTAAGGLVGLFGTPEAPTAHAALCSCTDSLGNISCLDIKGIAVQPIVQYCPAVLNESVYVEMTRSAGSGCRKSKVEMTSVTSGICGFATLCAPWPTSTEQCWTGASPATHTSLHYFKMHFNAGAESVTFALRPPPAGSTPCATIVAAVPSGLAACPPILICNDC